MEARVIARAFSLPRFTHATTSNGVITVAVVGPRASRMASIARGLDAQGIIMTGLAGALSPGLKIGDVVVNGELAGGKSGENGPRYHFGALHTSQAIVATPLEKQELFKKTGAARQ